MTRRRRRTGSVMLVVMWAIAIGAIILSSVQLFSYRQSMLGRVALGRVQARWAARGGLEYAIAIMADHTIEPVPGDAFAVVRDLDARPRRCAAVCRGRPRRVPRQDARLQLLAVIQLEEVSIG